jgi:methionine-rich copper-binding protein CopC
MFCSLRAFVARTALACAVLPALALVGPTTLSPFVGAATASAATAGTEVCTSWYSGANYAAGVAAVRVVLPTNGTDPGAVWTTDRQNAGDVLASYTVPGGPLTSVLHTFCVPVNSVPAGTKLLQFWITDASGASQVQSNWYVNAGTGPTVVSESPTPGSASSNRQPTVSLTLKAGQNPISSASATLDGSQPLTLTTGKGTVTLALPSGTDLTPGVHTVTWTVVDGAGNTYQGQYSFTIASPVISATGALVNGADIGGTGSACALVTVTDGQAAIPNVLVYVDGSMVSSFEGNASAGASVTHNVCLTPSTLSDGPHTLVIKATDSLGVQAQNTWTINVNSTGPELSASGAMISGTTVSGTASACTLVTVTDTLAAVPEVYIDLDGTFFSSFTGTAKAGDSVTHNVCLIPADLITNGPHTMTIRATDTRGVLASTTYTVNIGSLGPVITATGALVSGATLTGSTSVCAAVTVTDPQADVPEVDVILDGKFTTSFKGNAAAKGSATKNVCFVPSALGVGQHTLTIKAKDSLGSGGTGTWGLTVGAATS